ncbi:hypothetical protein BOTCAL_0248g00160 [Botryotinia calthae]|uniref:C2H2-type domain-containing protein n=1 Tax=Botryotinia calthae TaxID=38488 RepID=A0A4Y8CWR3_9HELO|nr:hypothetical protein BOTCAL_0248g00160 [Botryotinia calthae]
MSNLVASSFQRFVASSTSKNSLILDYYLHPSPDSCHNKGLGETIINVDSSLYSSLPIKSFDISHNTPLFDLRFMNALPCLDLTQTVNGMFPIDFKYGYQNYIVQTTLGPQSNKDTTRDLHLRIAPDTSRRKSSRGTESRGTYKSNRICCLFSNCSSSFARRGDLIRHQKSLHYPKTPCIYSKMGCPYETGRLDKMKEHTRKKRPTMPHFDRLEAKIESFLRPEISHSSESEVDLASETYDLSAFVWKDINLGAESLGMEFSI